MDIIIEQIEQYQKLSAESKQAFLNICAEQQFSKGAFLQREHERAHYIYFIRKGLVGYYTSSEKGNITYKMFFAENSFVASTAAVVSKQMSSFSIVALEDCEVVGYSAAKFRALYQAHHDVALFHIAYLEKNWVVAKEPMEIALRTETAKERYQKLKEDLPYFNRLKMHQVASYLGVTPTQLSRIRREIER